jgi:hypothetical protein
VRLCSDEGEKGFGWLGERHGETVVPRSPQDIIGRKDGCDEWNSAKALMRTEKSKYRMMARSGQVRTGQSDFAGYKDGSKTGHGCFLVGHRIDGDTDTSSHAIKII